MVEVMRRVWMNDRANNKGSNHCELEPGVFFTVLFNRVHVFPSSIHDPSLFLGPVIATYPQYQCIPRSVAAEHLTRSKLILFVSAVKNIS
jgi:hypothetical protein